MNCVAMKMYIAGLFSLNIWSIFTSASIPAATFDLCGIEEISEENVTLSLNFSAENAMKTGGECSRVVLLKSRRVKLTVEELNVTSGAVFEIQDGPGLNKGEKIGPKHGAQLPSSYVSSSNAMFIRFKGGNGLSIFRGKISSESYQDTCHCRAVTDGKLECFETERLRKCEVKCNSSYMELSINKEVTCDLKNGTWDIDIHSRPLVCQLVKNPLKVKTIVKFNYANLSCKQVDLQKVENISQEFIGNNSNVRSKGVCFSPMSAENQDCNEGRLQINCTANNNLSEISITITDRIEEPSNLTEANSNLQELYTAYNNLKLEVVLDSADLIIKEKNESFAIVKDSISIITTPWCDGGNDYIKVPGNATYFVCSTCPLNHWYNVATHTCEKCPSGSFSQTRARSCTQKNDTVTITPIKASCDNMCMKGKQMGVNSWMCEWCPRNTYQNSSTKINPKCVPCPGDKQTVFPGAQNVSECHDPCPNGTFLNVSSRVCQDCPVGTYTDVDNHAFIRCKMCEMGETTWSAGSNSSRDCYKCIPGQYFNSTTMMCSACPKGKYQDEMNQDSCKDCTSGTSTLEFGSKNSSECVKVCGLGTFFNESNGMCIDCPKNTYQNLTQHRTKECKSCGSNKITNATGQADISRCFVSCDKGSFLEKSVSQCKKCPKDHFQDQPGQDQCKECPDGKVTIDEGQSNESSCITTCMKGQFYETSNMTCSPCPFGTYQNTENHQRVSCQMCSSKKTSVNEGADDSKQCVTTGDEKGRYQVVMSLKFTSLSWSEQLRNENSNEYHKTKTKIEDAIKFELRKDPSFEDVKVTALIKGSVVADFELYFNDKMGYVPGQTLQDASQSGKVGNLSVSPESLKILRQDCAQPLGMENGKIEDDQISASTHFKNFEPYEGRLNLKGGGGWYAKYNRRVEYLQIDFKRIVNITAVATQGGHPEKLLYVKEYKLTMSDDGEIWNEYTENGKGKVFSGNSDSDTAVKNNLAHTVTSRFIRFLPQSWNEDIFMRVEVYGCLPNALLPTKHATGTTPAATTPAATTPAATTPAATTPAATTPAATTPDVAAVKADDSTWPWGAYLGIVFAVLLVVGIVVAIICWKKKSREKRHAVETDQALMGISAYGDGEYRVIEKNATEPDDEDDENVV